MCPPWWLARRKSSLHVFSIESCMMNNLNFGRYIEEILTRMKEGDKDYRVMLPCFYVEKTSEVMVSA